MFCWNLQIKPNGAKFSANIFKKHATSSVPKYVKRIPSIFSLGMKDMMSIWKLNALNFSLNVFETKQLLRKIQLSKETCSHVSDNTSVWTQTGKERDINDDCNYRRHEPTARFCGKCEVLWSCWISRYWEQFASNTRVEDKLSCARAKSIHPCT